MIPYIGDISEADARVLQILVMSKHNTLEFGCGASTQVLAAYVGDDPEWKVTSIDTSQEWMDKTKSNLLLLDIKKEVKFEEYHQFMQSLSTLKPQYDFIFDDGVDHLRRDFAIQIWPFLAVGGTIAFHDTRRAPDVRNVLEVIAHYQDEIDHVHFNVSGSNITIVRKKKAQPYENWQITENRLPWQLGYSEPDLEYIKNYKED